MCHEWWTERERRREERFDAELRYLLDEERERSATTPFVEHERDEEPVEHEPAPVEPATRL